MSQTIRVKLFAVAKQIAGAESVELALPERGTVADVRRMLLERYPSLSNLATLLLFAVNGEYAADATVIPRDAEVACIPPVSGG
ncbi:MAG: MoaD/ThiS family protein [Planctomycetia bacterium]|nr:MoaD/ThiS family protein [Planctomycetia bacterium]